MQQGEDCSAGAGEPEDTTQKLRANTVHPVLYIIFAPLRKREDNNLNVTEQ